MSTAFPTVTSILNRDQGQGVEGTGDSGHLSRSDVGEAVKTGVAEALADHRQSESADDVDAGDGTRTDAGSSRGPSLGRLAVLGLLASVVYLRRRGRRGSGSEQRQ